MFSYSSFYAQKRISILRKLIDHNIPFSVIAAGTSLPVNHQKNLFSGFSEKTLSLLRDVNNKATVFTTRGFLKQEFCHRHGLKNVRFNGDIAFYESDFTSRTFEFGKEINNIVISDPHRAEAYLDTFSVLVEGVKSVFPSSQVVVALHGENEEIERYC